ncbi:MAG: cell division protein FtsK, partial [Actinomycetia bacterium]|nr:cell division protein FtsK [Actinomycetes bacterium]
MQLALSLVTDGGRGRRDLLIRADPHATVGDVARAIRGAGSQQDPDLAVVLTHPRLHGSPETLWTGGHPLDPALPAGSALADGVLVALDEHSGPATWLGEPSGLADLRVSGGPLAGTVARLGIGESAIGSGPSCQLVLADPAVPPLAATVALALDGTAILTPHVPLTLDGVSAAGPVPWPPGAVARLGDHALALAIPEPPDAHLTPADDGGRAYNRPPRLLPPPRGRRLVVPQQPQKGDAVRFQLLSAILPLAAGVVLWIVTNSALSLLFCLMSPLLLIGSWVSDTRFGRKKHRTAIKNYRERKATFDTELESLRAQDQAARRESAPDPAAALLVATGPRRRLWERRLDDPDALHLRVGITDLPASIELVAGPDAARDATPPVPPTVHSVPVSVPLASLGVVGIAGPRPQALGLARWLLAQAAILHSPRDLSIAILSAAPTAAAEWGWAGWLPHVAPRDGQDCRALIGADADTVSRRVAELVAEIARRRESASAVGTVPAGPAENIVVVLDGARALRRVPGMPHVLAEGPRVGIHAICVDEDERLLPEECRTVIGWPGPGARIRFRGGGLELLGEILADAVTPAWCERLARALAPIRDVSRDEEGSGIPDSARLLTLLGMPDPSAADVLATWNKDGRTTDVPLGYTADGVYRLDLRRDGPHALVAGTTGAGKSELLQSLIAALAVANRPDTLNFVLIDYKGGSAFQDCARLPHTVGMVSDLDGHLTARALDSLAAELKRREEMLFDAHAKDIEDYWRAKRRSPNLPPLPRLVLVIDEFASLVEELPDFVAGLVDIARRGRSLGVHLVLATQRPAGVVSADIRANTNLRIALRVTSADDSQDVIDSRDAATIAKSHPGRAYVRSGASSLVLAQAARIGGRRPSTGSRVAARVSELRWPDLGRPLPPTAQSTVDDDAPTDLAVLVDAVCDAARDAGIPPQPSPWLAPLPAVVSIGELAAEPGSDETPPAPYGLCDVPSEQARVPLVLDLPSGGNLLIAGAPRSGRSTVLRTIAGSVASRTAPDDVHLYAIDCGANALLPLVSLPHCGA